MCTKLVRGRDLQLGRTAFLTKVWVFEHKIGYNLACIRYTDMSQILVPNWRFLEVGQFHDVIQIGLWPTPVAMVMKSLLFGHKIGYN